MSRPGSHDGPDHPTTTAGHHQRLPRACPARAAGGPPAPPRRRARPGRQLAGRPLLWPADAPWPTCRGLRLVDRRQPIAPAELRRFRAILDAADRRWRPSEGQALEFTEEEAAEVDRIVAGAASLDLTAGERIYPEPQPHRDPVALVAVLQLYARDVPGLPFPEHADLFQLLWCPNHHDPPRRRSSPHVNNPHAQYS